MFLGVIWIHYCKMDLFWFILQRSLHPKSIFKMGREDKWNEKGNKVPGLEGGASHSILYSSSIWLNDNDLKTKLASKN